MPPKSFIEWKHMLTPRRLEQPQRHSRGASETVAPGAGGAGGGAGGQFQIFRMGSYYYYIS